MLVLVTGQLIVSRRVRLDRLVFDTAMTRLTMAQTLFISAKYSISSLMACHIMCKIAHTFVRA